MKQKIGFPLPDTEHERGYEKEKWKNIMDDFAIFSNQNPVPSIDEMIAAAADYDDDDVSKEVFDFNDFLAIFLKGIFKDVVCGIANTVQNFTRKD